MFNHRPTAIALLLSFSLASCAVMDFDSPNNTNGGAQMAPPLIVDGYGNPAPELQQPMPTIDNPDEPSSEEWDEPVLAASPEEADRICRRLADQYGVSLGRVQQPREVKPKNQSYRCWFRS